MSATQSSKPAPVLLYDGVCGVCNSAVRTILRFDRRGTLRFAALDSEFAGDIRARHPQLEGLDSAVFVENPGSAGESVHVRSAALLRVAAYLGGWWRMALVGYALPVVLRDGLYDRFAAIRYQVGGKHNTCPVPSPGVRARFVDSTYG